VGGENRGGGAHSFCFLVRVKARLSWLAPGLSPTTSWSRSRGKKKSEGAGFASSAFMQNMAVCRNVLQRCSLPSKRGGQSLCCSLEYKRKVVHAARWNKTGRQQELQQTPFSLLTYKSVQIFLLTV
jgi:hypothetical protein